MGERTITVCSGNPDELQVSVMCSICECQLYHIPFQMFIEAPTAERMAVMRYKPEEAVWPRRCSQYMSVPGEAVPRARVAMAVRMRVVIRTR